MLQGSIRTHTAGCAWFWAWALVGCAGAFALLVGGVLALAPVAAVVWLMASRPTTRRSSLGIVTGIGVSLLYVAWVQRAGPGTTCRHTASASGCDQHLDPLPWLLTGLALVVGGVVAHGRRS